jgi:hypothetical protein
MRALFMIAVLAVAACGDNIEPATRDAGSDADADAAIDAPPQAIGPCLDRPAALADSLRAPTAGLPCELVPPGFVAEAP